ncbi:hypothetical protein [Nocardia altamirensis]|uniref:hypothetical protein n=1 Tax=Nocardia altamirensis TaxID=472158 RepID=UPI00083FFF23|nr:hypothetical protein [Nocardia altamirensis]
MAVQFVAGSQIYSDLTGHSVQKVGEFGWVMANLRGWHLTEERGVAMVWLAEAFAGQPYSVGDPIWRTIEDSARTVGLTAHEAAGMLGTPLQPPIPAPPIVAVDKARRWQRWLTRR